MVVLFHKGQELSAPEPVLEYSSVIHLKLSRHGGGAFMVGRLGNGGRSSLLDW